MAYYVLYGKKKKIDAGLNSNSTIYVVGHYTTYIYLGAGESVFTCY